MRILSKKERLQNQCADIGKKVMKEMPDTEQMLTNSIIEIGKYPQYYEDQADKIAWIILKIDTKTMLLISRFALITTAYCDRKKIEQDLCFLEWENSLARELCMQFYETAFSFEEKNLMVRRRNRAGESGNGDYVFLLTEEEVKEYLPDLRLRKARPTHYALEKGARLGWTKDTSEYTSWWIMPETKGMEQGQIFSAQGTEYKKHRIIYPKAIFQNGEIQYHGRNIFHGDFTIRPCILINCEKYLSMREKEEIRYFRLTSGLLIKIDRKHMTCFRFNSNQKEWNEDSVMFTEYEHGELLGELVDFDDHYPTGKPFTYSRNCI